ATTDKDGHFRLTGFGRERLVQLSLRGPTIEWRQGDVYTMTRAARTFHRPLTKRAPALGNAVYHGATFEPPAAPTRPLTGTATGKDTGKPVAGVTVQSQHFATRGTLLLDFVRVKSDAEGRYRLVGMPKGEGNEIRAVPGPGEPYFACLRRVG